MGGQPLPNQPPNTRNILLSLTRVTQPPRPRYLPSTATRTVQSDYRSILEDCQSLQTPTVAHPVIVTVILTVMPQQMRKVIRVLFKKEQISTIIQCLGCQLLKAMEESPAPAATNSGPLSMPGDFNDLFLPGKSHFTWNLELLKIESLFDNCRWGWRWTIAHCKAFKTQKAR